MRNLERFQNSGRKKRRPDRVVRMLDDTIHSPVQSAKGSREFVVVLDSGFPEFFSKRFRIALDTFGEGDLFFLAEIGDDSRLHADGTLFARILAGVAIRFAKIRFHSWKKCRHEPLTRDYFLFGELSKEFAPPLPAYGAFGKASSFDWSMRRVFTTIPNAVAEPDSADTRRWQLTQSLTVCPTLAATASASPEATAPSISPQAHSGRTPTAFSARRHCAV